MVARRELRGNVHLRKLGHTCTSLTGGTGTSIIFEYQITLEGSLKPREYARKAVDVASEKQASDILLLDIRKVSGFTDYFVIMSTESHRQMDAVAESLVVTFKEAGASLHHREGSMSSGWILLDFGEVILHLFYKEVREHYQLEKLWSTGKTVLRVQ